MKYEYLVLEEQDVREELTQYILDFEKRFNKYYVIDGSEEKSIWVDEESGEVRDTPPPQTSEERIKEEQEKREQSRKEKFKLKKTTPKKFKSLYKKLSSVTHPDRGGDASDFLKVKELYENGDLIGLLYFADKYNIEFELQDNDVDIIEDKAKSIEQEIQRMRATLAWFWGTADIKGKLEVIRRVEAETKKKVKVEDYPEELQPQKPKEIKLLTQ